ncbi:MFS, DHA1 sub-family [Auriculariales sp. MPI-PUGE-AT-0066]|nr:MFS, DHA1 sub-family [Auriculariales sp. MPI-PUGE-AT-0066]
MARIEAIIFLSLVLDLLAFTIPLPLFPRIVEWYHSREGSDPNGFLSRTLHGVQTLRTTLYRPATVRENRRWDVVLLGGLMGSLFSTLQFIVSPFIGSLSDTYGRKTILLATMAGNILSALIWIQSTTFASYLLSRAVGGLSEGNVQLAIAILSDVTTPQTRSRALALIGIAFSVCFCVGPPIGAWFALRPSSTLPLLGGHELNIYAWPATLTLVLLVLETAFLTVALPETLQKKTIEKPSEKKEPQVPRASAEQRLATLKALKTIHFAFLVLFSGVEFTLTFLTFDLFDWNNLQNGRLIGSMGILSALLQGGYVRRSIPKVGELKMASSGVTALFGGLTFLSILPQTLKTGYAMAFLYGATICLAFTSATVVTALNGAASLQCDESAAPTNPKLAKGRAMGEYRSWGQLGRALGPIFACGMYWTVGPTSTYGVFAAATALLAMHMRRRVLLVKKKVE